MERHVERLPFSGRAEPAELPMTTSLLDLLETERFESANDLGPRRGRSLPGTPQGLDFQGHQDRGPVREPQILRIFAVQRQGDHLA